MKDQASSIQMKEKDRRRTTSNRVSLDKSNLNSFNIFAPIFTAKIHQVWIV